MTQELNLSRSRLTTPRAAAIAGIVFSMLYIAAIILVRTAVPEKPEELGDWLSSGWRTVEIALNILPFAGIAFLWFIGVVRDRLGEHEDRFFATVFFGSGLLFLAMLFTSAAVAGGILTMYGVDPTALIVSGIYTYGRMVTYELMNVYTLKMAGVFMISMSTLTLRTGIAPRWMAYLGFILAIFLLISLGLIYWAPLVFPLYVLTFSIYILIANYRRNQR
jgi:hypothetical protein